VSKLAAIRTRLGAFIAGKAASAAASAAAPRGQRLYHGAKNSRLTQGWGTASTSADAEISLSLGPLRNRSRALVRDASYAKRARDVVVNNVVGHGIGLQAQVMTTRDKLAERINADIERAWCEWGRASRCHTGGVLSLVDIMRQCMAQVFEAGEIFVRKHPRAFGDSAVPLALEIIEPERIADDYAVPQVGGANVVRMGVEVDTFGRPVAYWVRDLHVGDIQRRTDGKTSSLTRVPAAEIIHLHLVDRWPQTRGVPWMHTAMRRLNDMEGYSEAEIVAARSSANVVGFIKSPEAPTPEMGTEGQAGMPELAFEPGMIEHLAPGEDFVGFNPSRPNPAMDAFMRMMLREVAAGIGVSYESISRDYSQSNYSSSRLSLLDDRDTWRVLQQWFIRSFCEPLFREWLMVATFARAVPTVSVAEYATNPAKFEAASWKPRGWLWVDPTKEVTAYKEAIKAGMTTLTSVIAATGGGQDIEDVIRERKRELQMLEEADIDVDTTVEEPMEPAAPAAPAAAAEPADAEDAAATTDSEDPATPARRVVNFARPA
jgi:lambda family phage portal protein